MRVVSGGKWFMNVYNGGFGTGGFKTRNRYNEYILTKKARDKARSYVSRDKLHVLCVLPPESALMLLFCKGKRCN